MGQFESGRWIVGLLLYFFVIFLVTYCVAAGIPDSGIASPSDPGFGTANPTSSADFQANGTTNIDYDVSATSGWSNFKASLGILTGINSGGYVSMIPSAWQFAFSFLFFWIPFFMLLWSIYMALPVVH